MIYKIKDLRFTDLIYLIVENPNSVIAYVT